MRGRVAALFLRFFFDFSLLLLAATGYVLLGYYFNFGELRFFSLLGLIGGFFLLRVTLGRVLYSLFRFILKSIFAIFGAILRPVGKMLRKTAKCLQNLASKLAKALAKILYMVYNIYVKIYTLKRSNEGFLGGRFKR